MRQTTREVPSWTGVLTACLLLTSCATTYRPNGQYGQTLDTGSNGCRHNPALCHPAIGEHSPTIPSARPPPASLEPLPTAPTGAQASALNIAAAARVVQVTMDATLMARIRTALAECADTARSDVMYRHFQRSPTREECNEVVEHDAQGQPITRAMLLGREQHRVALECAQQRLNEIKPGGFSLSPRYRYDPSTGLTQLLLPDQVKALLDQGLSAELRGTIEPDIVIHEPGQPLHVQAVFDFKFPCANGGNTPWRTYSKGHPFEGQTQKEVYMRLLSDKVFRVLPRWGGLQ